MKNVNDFKGFLDNKVNLNESRITKLGSKVEIITTLLKDKLGGYKNYSLQGSYAHKTIIKPVKDSHEFDADILVFIKNDSFSLYQFTDYVKEIYAIFQNNDNYKDIAKLNTRCVTIDYAGDFHLDIVPCIEYNNTHYICNRTDNKYEVTDGDGYQKWLTEKNKTVGNNNFIKTTKLFKFLRDHKSNFSAKSILLTTLLGNQVHHDNNYSDLPTTLKILSNDINDYLQKHSSMPTIFNPVLQSEDFNRHWNQTKYSNFRKLFNVYNSKINEAFVEKNHNESIKKWRKLFGDDFGELKNIDTKIATGTESVLLSGIGATKPYAGESIVQSQMPSIVYKYNDFSLLNNIFPDLYYDKENNTIKGELSFNAHYKNTGKKGINRWKIFSCTTGKSCLEGYYEIEIDLNTDIPTVYETSKKIQKLAKKLGKSNNDLHLYDNYKCCLGVYIDTNILSKFIIGYIYPYFVWQAYFEKYYKVPPCGEYSHNRKIAEIECLTDSINGFKNLGVNDLCPCESGKKYKRCHGLRR